MSPAPSQGQAAVGVQGCLTMRMANALVLVEEEGVSTRADLVKVSRKHLPAAPTLLPGLGCRHMPGRPTPRPAAAHTSEPPHRLILVPGAPPLVRVPPDPWPGRGTPPLPPPTPPQAPGLPHHCPWASGLEQACLLACPLRGQPAESTCLSALSPLLRAPLTPPPRAAQLPSVFPSPGARPISALMLPSF